MKVLVLNTDLMERTVIQQVLQRNGHEIVPAETSDAAMHHLQQGGIRFVIADRWTSEAAHESFKREFATEYTNLSERGERLHRAEHLIDRFHFVE